MFDSFHSLFPQINEPSWQQIVVALSIIVVGFLVQRYILRPSITGVSKFFRKRGRLFFADIIRTVEQSDPTCIMVIVIAISVSACLKYGHLHMKQEKN